MSPQQSDTGPVEPLAGAASPAGAEPPDLAGEVAVPRRAVLGLAAGGAGALVLGWAGLAGAQDGAGGPGERGWEEEAWAAARAAQAARGAHGLAVVLPPDAAGRRRVAAALERLIPVFGHEGVKDLPPLVGWLLELVWVCAAPERVGAAPGETLVLLDPRGQRVAGAAVPLDDPAAFAAGLEALAGGERLAARAARVPAAGRRAVAGLRGTPAERQAAWEHLEARGDAALPAVVHAWRTTDDDGHRRSLEGFLFERYERQVRQPAGLPFGVRWRVEVTNPEPCPPCGMASPTVTGRKFLVFWGK